MEVLVIPTEVTTQMEMLRQHLNDARLQRDQLSQRVAELGMQARSQFINQDLDARGQRIRQQWRQVTKELHQCGLRVLAQWPTHLDIEAFTQEEWTSLLQTQEITRLIMEACLRAGKETGQVIEARQMG